MSLSSKQASSRLDQVKTPKQLRKILFDLDLGSEGTVTMLYSGTIISLSPNGSDSITARLLSEAISESSEEIRIIDKTEAAKFLNISPNSPNQNKALIETLIRLFGDNPNRFGTESHQFLYGQFIDGKRIPNGVWDSISYRFAI